MRGRSGGGRALYAESLKVVHVVVGVVQRPYEVDVSGGRYAAYARRHGTWRRR